MGSYRKTQINLLRSMFFYLFLSRNFVSDIHGKTGQLIARGTGSAQQVGGAGGAYDMQQTIRVLIFSLIY
jgi:hypothetical protein